MIEEREYDEDFDGKPGTFICNICGDTFTVFYQDDTRNGACIYCAPEVQELSAIADASNNDHQQKIRQAIIWAACHPITYKYPSLSIDGYSTIYHAWRLQYNLNISLETIANYESLVQYLEEMPEEYKREDDAGAAIYDATKIIAEENKVAFAELDRRLAEYVANLKIKKN